MEYKNKIRQLRVRTLDGGAVKTVFVDESQPVSQLMIVVCSKMGISNHEEYSLVRAKDSNLDGELNGNGVTNGNSNGYQTNSYSKDTKQNGYQTNGKDKRFENTFMNTIGRKKERQIQQLRLFIYSFLSF